MIELSQAAANEIRRLQHSRSLSGGCFRIGVKPGGCAGLYYTLELNENPGKSERIYSIQEINISIAADSEQYLINLKLDYAEDLMGGGFRFHNPNADKTCGCGLSFTVSNSGQI
jgi:iron-sulfur cluster assembly accessory protein